MSNKKISPYKLWNGSFVPEWLMPRKELSQGAKLCYSRLARYAGKDDHCNPQVKTLAGSIGVSSRQCRSYIKELAEHNLIGKKRRGMGKSNVYEFYWHEWMNPRSEASGASDQDRKDSSDQGGRIVPDRPEDNCRTDRKDTSDPNIEESHSKRVNEENTYTRVNGVTLPEELADVEGFVEKYEFFCRYMKENFNRWPTATTTEVDLQQLVMLKRKGHPPKKVIDQTMQSRNKKFYKIIDFDDEDDVNGPADHTGWANANAYKEYEG